MRRSLFWPQRALAVRLGFGLLPDFIIIGTQRGGTDSLYHYLIRHPKVKGALRKEVHFFDLNYAKGIAWYQTFFPVCIGATRDFLTGEASPYYLFHPLAPSRVAEMLPDVKLIVQLRNPVDRAYSHYQHGTKRGIERVSFEDALAREERVMENELRQMQTSEHYKSTVHRHYSYVSRGIYVDQLRRWVEKVPRERFLVLKSEDLFEQPDQTFRQVLDFLGLPAWSPPRFLHYNASTYRSKMSATTWTRLHTFFSPYNAQLSDLLGMEFSEWDRS
jgi:sulfotransferase family protein